MSTLAAALATAAALLTGMILGALLMYLRVARRTEALRVSLAAAQARLETREALGHDQALERELLGHLAPHRGVVPFDGRHEPAHLGLGPVALASVAVENVPSYRLKKSVAVAPGHRIVTVTPVPRNSCAIASPKLST